MCSSRAYPSSRFELQPNGACILYTDGVERRGETLDVGMERLLQQLDSASCADARECCDRVLRVVDDEHEDDVAVLVGRRE